MIIAGPGTGKTRTLTHRIAAAIASQQVRPEQCLALTFTRRAAEEMRERLAALLGRRAARLTVTTFHGLGLMLLREQHELAGLAADFSVADEQAVLEVATELAGTPRAARAWLAAAAGDAEQRGRLREALAARGLVDFDGLVELSTQVLHQAPAVAAALRQRWPWVSVDEYQDVNAAQYELLRLLAGDGAGLTVIGDPDQAIYGFRGADVGFFLRFAADYPAASTVALSTNYRSRPGIVAGALQAIAPGTLAPGRTLRAAGGEPGTISYHEAADPASEAAWIAAAIDRLLGGSSFHSLDSGRADGHGHDGIGLADIAVLYRTDAQAAALGQGLTRAGLPFQKRSHDLLERRPGVAEIVREIQWRAESGRSAADQLRAAVTRLAAIAGGSPLGDGEPRGRLSSTDLRAAGEVLAPLARRCGADLHQFLTEIALGAEVDALDPRADAISLLTLHAAKGLEFEVVFLAGCERGLLPLWLPGRGPGEGPDPAEERRLLFVGMTRARAHLLLSSAARRGRPGGPAEAGRPRSWPRSTRRCWTGPPRRGPAARPTASSACCEPAHPSQVQEHAGVAQGVGLDPVQVEELGHAFVVGPEQLRVDLMGDRGALDLGEAVPGEETDREREHEDPLHAHLAGAVQQRGHQAVADSVALAALCTATVRISARSSHITCSAPQPTTAWSAVRSATQNSGTSSYSVTVALRSTRPDATLPATRPVMAGMSRVRARRIVCSIARTLARARYRPGRADGSTLTPPPLRTER